MKWIHSLYFIYLSYALHKIEKISPLCVCTFTCMHTYTYIPLIFYMFILCTTQNRKNICLYMCTRAHIYIYLWHYIYMTQKDTYSTQQFLPTFLHSIYMFTPSHFIKILYQIHMVLVNTHMHSNFCKRKEKEFSSFSCEKNITIGCKNTGRRQEIKNCINKWRNKSTVTSNSFFLFLSTQGCPD